MHHNCGHGRKKFDHIISVRYGIHTVSGRFVKAQQLCSIKSVQRISGSCKRTCSKRTGIHTFTNISHTASVPAEHLKICPYMMCQCNRLCFLQMRKSRHICVHIILHDHLKSFQKFLQFCIDLFDLITHIQFHIKSDLVITTSSCMKLLTRISDTVNQICLYKTVNIFIFRCNLQFSGFYICKNTVQTAKDLISFFFCQDALLGQHSDMSFTSADILFIKFLVK